MTRQVAQLASRVILAFILGCYFLYAQEPDKKAAQQSVESWLSLVDSRSYAASWDTAATIFKNAVTQDKWQAAVQSVRGPLGQLKSRTLKNASATSAPPGAPAGDYVVFQFETAFETRAGTVETVTAIREADGSWHVGGYFIK
jgi:hypothetical protein